MTVRPTLTIKYSALAGTAAEADLIHVSGVIVLAILKMEWEE
jgi:hypothetical protein